MDKQAPQVAAIPVATLRLVIVGIAVVIVIMLAMLGIEVVILLRVLELLDLIKRLVPPA